MSQYEPPEMSALRGIVIAQQQEIEELKAALKGARKFGLQQGFGLRAFSQAIGARASRVSEWTAEPSSGPPDIVCRR